MYDQLNTGFVHCHIARSSYQTRAKLEGKRTSC